jgi:hypothetical protein
MRHLVIIVVECIFVLISGVGTLMSLSASCSTELPFKTQIAVIVGVAFGSVAVMTQKLLWPVARKWMKRFSDWSLEPEALFLLVILAAMALFSTGLIVAFRIASESGSSSAPVPASDQVPPPAAGPGPAPAA